MLMSCTRRPVMVKKIDARHKEETKRASGIVPQVLLVLRVYDRAPNGVFRQRATHFLRPKKSRCAVSRSKRCHRSFTGRISRAQMIVELVYPGTMARLTIDHQGSPQRATWYCPSRSWLVRRARRVIHRIDLASLSINASRLTRSWAHDPPASTARSTARASVSAPWWTR